MPTPVALRRVRRAAAPTVLAAALAALAGCTAARAPLDPVLAREERLAVQGRDGWRIGQRVTFGEFVAHDVARSGARGPSGERTGFDAVTRRSASRRQSYGFWLRATGDTTGGAAVWRGECATAFDGAEDTQGPIVQRSRARQSVECRLRSTDGQRWRLSVAEDEREAMGGLLVREDAGGPPMTVRPITRLTGSSITLPRAVGWELVLDGRALGAVDPTNGGTVVLPRTLGTPFRRTLAAAATALLLFDDLGEGLAGR